MMKEIKFRVWDKKNKKFLKPYREQHIGNWVNTLSINMDGSLSFHEDDGFGGKSVGGESIEKRFEIMQYTELKDKNGIEIYEGDILTSHCYPFQDDGRYNYHGLVEWFDDYGGFYITNRLVNRKMMGLSDGISEPIENTGRFEIIGNICENKELLKEINK